MSDLSATARQWQTGRVKLATVSVSKARAAEILDVSPRTIDRMIGRGELETEREQGGRHRVLVRVTWTRRRRMPAMRMATLWSWRFSVREQGLEDRVRYMNERLGMSDALNIELQQPYPASHPGVAAAEGTPVVEVLVIQALLRTPRG